MMRRNSRNNNSGGLPTSYDGRGSSFSSVGSGGDDLNIYSSSSSNNSRRGSNGNRFSNNNRRRSSGFWNFGSFLTSSSGKSGNGNSNGNSSSSLLVMISILCGFASIMFTGLWMNNRSKYSTLLHNLDVKNAHDAVDLLVGLKDDLHELERKIRTSEKTGQYQFSKKVKVLQEQSNDLQQERDKLQDQYEGPDQKNAVAKSQRREQGFQQQIEWLQQAIRKESKRTVLERFGPGPHQVQLTFEVPQVDNDDKGKPNNKSYDMVIELARLDTVPHAIHLFLEQVEHGLWNGAYFYMNAEHVMQAGPEIRKEEEDEHVVEEDYVRKAVFPFSKLQLDKLAFPDYSHEYPHVEWTLGFAGRPGGPDFYINKDDNTEVHGPGGQFQHALEEQGDSCFGRVIKGREHVEALYKRPVRLEGDDWDYYYLDPVKIVKGVVLTPKPAPNTKISMQRVHPIDIDFGRSLNDLISYGEPQMTLIEKKE